jgi:hypothetical protein
MREITAQPQVGGGINLLSGLDDRIGDIGPRGFGPQGVLNDRRFREFVDENISSAGSEDTRRYLRNLLESGGNMVIGVFVLPYLERELKPIYGEDKARRIATQMASDEYDRVLEKHTPGYREAMRTMEGRGASGADESLAISVINQALSATNTGPVRLLDAFSPVIVDKHRREAMADRVFKDMIGLHGLTRAMADAMERGEEVRGDKLVGEPNLVAPGSETPREAPRTVGLTAEELKEASGIDISQFIENMLEGSVTPGSPQWDELQERILNNPGVVNIVRDMAGSAQHLISSIVTDTIDDEKNARKESNNPEA